MSRLEQSTYWSLTVHYYPQAADAGVRPVPLAGFDDRYPGTYIPHRFDFAHPPSREDFIGVISHLPWAHGLCSELLPLLERNDWPMIDEWHKAASETLLDVAGRDVGRLSVFREYTYLNAAYVTLPVPNQLIDRAARGDPELRQYLDSKENAVREAVSKLGRPAGYEDVSGELRKLAAGWRKKRREVPGGDAKPG